jgi:hypothetical protein
MKIEIDLDDIFVTDEDTLKDVLSKAIIEQIGKRLYSEMGSLIRENVIKLIEQNVDNKIKELLNNQLSKKLEIPKTYGSEGFSGTIEEFIDKKIEEKVFTKNNCRINNKDIIIVINEKIDADYARITNELKRKIEKMVYDSVKEKERSLDGFVLKIEKKLKEIKS